MSFRVVCRDVCGANRRLASSAASVGKAARIAVVSARERSGTPRPPGIVSQTRHCSSYCCPHFSFSPAACPGCARCRRACASCACSSIVHFGSLSYDHSSWGSAAIWATSILPTRALTSHASSLHEPQGLRHLPSTIAPAPDHLRERTDLVVRPARSRSRGRDHPFVSWLFHDLYLRSELRRAVAEV